LRSRASLPEIKRAKGKEIAMTQFAIKRREFSLRSMLFGAVSIVALGATIIIDLAGVLQYFGVFSGLPPTALEIGAAITAATVVPFLLMGMSISADMHRDKRNANN
jgi:nitric oxide reductase large subunit